MIKNRHAHESSDFIRTSARIKYGVKKVGILIWSKFNDPYLKNGACNGHPTSRMFFLYYSLTQKYMSNKIPPCWEVSSPLALPLRAAHAVFIETN